MNFYKKEEVHYRSLTSSLKTSTLLFSLKLVLPTWGNGQRLEDEEEETSLERSFLRCWLFHNFSYTPAPLLSNGRWCEDVNDDSRSCQILLYQIFYKRVKVCERENAFIIYTPLHLGITAFRGSLLGVLFFIAEVPFFCGETSVIKRQTPFPHWRPT